MLTKYKDVRPKKGVKSPLKMFLLSVTYSRKFFRKVAPKCAIFSSAFIFSGKNILKYIQNKKDSREPRGMLSRKIFKNLHTMMAILALFEQFLVKFCINFLPLNLNVSPNMMHFVRNVHFRL